MCGILLKTNIHNFNYSGELNSSITYLIPFSSRDFQEKLLLRNSSHL